MLAWQHILQSQGRVLVQQMLVCARAGPVAVLKVYNTLAIEAGCAKLVQAL